jgi:hypothetical protein
VTLRREDLAPKARVVKAPGSARPVGGKAGGLPSAHPHAEASDPNVVWLSTKPEPAFRPEAEPGLSGPAATLPNAVLDDTAVPDEPYKYVAERRLTVQIGGRTLELRSAASEPQTFVLRDNFPPATPTDATAAVFAEGTGGKLGVDLVWQPVDDPRLAGYNVYRQAVDAKGQADGAERKLNAAPVTSPGFHDEMSGPVAEGTRYRYEITATDAKGNESARCELMVDPARP